MKKSKICLVLAASTVGLLSLAGCNEVTSKGNVLISFKNTNGEYTDYTADELFANYTNNANNSTQDYYNAIYNVMVREWFNKEENKSLKTECDKAAQISVESDVTTAETKSDDNGTWFDDEWEAILNSKLSELAEEKRSKEQLLLKYQLEEYKEALEDKYYDEFKTWKKDAGADAVNNLFWGQNGYLNEKIPYHVAHILVNVDAEDGHYYDGTVSSENVEKLYKVISELAKGTNFGQVAEDYSGDGSASMYGDLDPMTNDTEYVNEFKLGLYAFDTFFNTNSEINNSLANNSNPFSIPEEEAKYVKQLGIAEIPYGAIVKMNEMKDITKDSQEREVNDGDVNYYPRNVLFNKYFNNHNLAFITPDSLSGANPTLAQAGDTLNAHYSDLNADGKWTNGSQNSTFAQMSGFQSISLKQYDAQGNATSNVTKKVLCDSEGNPIIVVRAGTSSYQGIHFIIVKRSGLEQNKQYTSGTETYNVALNEYYASENPLTSNGNKNSNFPVTEGGVQKTTYVNSYNMDYSGYADRVNTIKDKAKEFDLHYDMRIFEWLKNNLSVTFNNISGAQMEQKINSYIETTRNATKNDLRVSNEETWNTFIEKLEVQQSQRMTKLIPETCALHFEEGFKDNQDQTVKGACYHEK